VRTLIAAALFIILAPAIGKGIHQAAWDHVHFPLSEQQP
jgi:hypothetical protein